MKKLSLIILANVILVLLMSGCGKATEEAKQNSTKNANTSVSSMEVNAAEYKDGTYEGRYDDGTEGFYCIAKITISSNKITNVDWNIYDKSNRVFDESYEDLYNTAAYKQQCRDDLKGSKTYGSKLIQEQDIQKVDAVTGATWTNKLFKGAIKRALEKAK